MLLENKTAILYGGAGHVGSTVAHGFARSVGSISCSPETFGPHVAVDSDGQPAGLADTDYLQASRSSTLLKDFPSIGEVGETAALIASDSARAMTGAAVNITRRPSCPT